MCCHAALPPKQASFVFRFSASCNIIRTVLVLCCSPSTFVPLHKFLSLINKNVKCSEFQRLLLRSFGSSCFQWKVQLLSDLSLCPFRLTQSPYVSDILSATVGQVQKFEIRGSWDEAYGQPKGLNTKCRKLTSHISAYQRRSTTHTHTHKDNKENRITQLILARLSLCNELMSGVVIVAENWYLSKGFKNLYVHKNFTRKKAVL